MTKITKLVAKQFTINEEFTITYKKGYIYTYMIDPKTGKAYDPIEGYEVTGEDLGSMFREILYEEINEEEKNK